MLTKSFKIINSSNKYSIETISNLVFNVEKRAH